MIVIVAMILIIMMMRIMRMIQRMIMMIINKPINNNRNIQKDKGEMPTLSRSHRPPD
jgi:hypothetical protein